MRRELRRFLLVGWTLLDAPAHAAVNLRLEWKRRFGQFPLRPDVAQGFHFRTQRGRAVYIPREGAQVPETLIARAGTVIATKYAVETRSALRSELPTPTAQRPPSARAYEAVELWPPAEDFLRGEVVFEYVSGGLFVPASRLETPEHVLLATPDPREALRFDSIVDAEEWRRDAASREALQLRYLAGALAEFDLREAEAAGTW